MMRHGMSNIDRSKLNFRQKQIAAARRPPKSALRRRFGLNHVKVNSLHQSPGGWTLVRGGSVPPVANSGRYSALAPSASLS
jgi:hypothetical protein